MAAAKYSRYYVFIKPVIENQAIKSSAPYIFSLITITIFLVFAIRPTITTISNLQKSIENNRLILEQLNVKARNLAEGKRNLSILESNFGTKVREAIPYRTAVTSLIASLQASQLVSASISAIQIQPVNLFNDSPATLDQLGEIAFAYSARGSYNQLLTVLDQMAKAPRLINIDSVVMSNSAGGVPTLSVTGKAYYLR